MTADVYDAQTVTAWLGYVHHHAIEAGLGGIVNIAAPTGSREHPKWRSRCFRLDELDRAGVRAVQGSDHDLNIYYRVHLLDAPVEPWFRGKSVLTRWITHFAADVDIAGPGHNPPTGKTLPTLKEAMRLIDATLAPSAIIASGGGLYPVWRLAEPFAIPSGPLGPDADEVLGDVRTSHERIKDIGRRIDAALASHGFHVDATCMDLARVIRPPGVCNRKPGRDVRPVTVMRGWFNGAGDYTIEQLETMLPAIAPKTVKAKPTDTHDLRLSNAAKSPWELFASRFTIDDVLAADPHREWEEVGMQGGMRAWRYLGSAHDYSIKQSPTGAIIVWSSTIADVLGKEPGGAVDLWGLACGLAGRDATEAAKRRKP